MSYPIFLFRFIINSSKSIAKMNATARTNLAFLVLILEENLSLLVACPACDNDIFCYWLRFGFWRLLDNLNFGVKEINFAFLSI